MEGSESGEQFLHKKDSRLHISKSVEHEQRRRKIAGESVSQKPADKIAHWLGVIERTHISHRDDPRVIERIKAYYHREYVIKPENIPQSYWNLQGEIAVNEGRKQDLIDAGVSIEETTIRDQTGQEVKKRSYTFPEEVKEEAVRTLVSNQAQSLDSWVDYLTSDDAPYPMWAKYWAFRSVVKMGKLEKTEDGKARFAVREKNTTSSFPVLNQRALANTIGSMTARLEIRDKTKSDQITKNLSTTLSDEEYQKLLSTEDFSKLYAQFLAEIPEYSASGLEETQGRWVKYNQNSDPAPLVASLQGHPLEWCTADMETARIQLKGGDFYVYYSLDEDGNSTIPRLAIRMQGTRIAEPPRGIAPDQNLDPYISDVLVKKLEEFGSEGEAFRKRTDDMKRLTEIEKKSEANISLTREDLRFLYELDSKIEGFGYHKDPRIEEIRSSRKPEEDMPIVFGCTPGQIAHNIGEIRPDTKAYVHDDRLGPLEKGIFDRLEGIEYIYTSFPEDRIQIEETKLKEKSKFQLIKDLDNAKVNFPYAKTMIENREFTVSPPETIKTVRLKVADLGLKNGGTTAEIIGTKDDVDRDGNPAPFTKGKMTEMGLGLCPDDFGVYKRLEDTNQPLGDYYWIAMQPIADRDGDPHVFELYRDGGGLWLNDGWADPDGWWGPEDVIVFRLRKSEPQTPKPSGIFGRFFKH